MQPQNISKSFFRNFYTVRIMNCLLIFRFSLLLMGGMGDKRGESSKIACQNRALIPLTSAISHQNHQPPGSQGHSWIMPCQILSKSTKCTLKILYRETLSLIYDSYILSTQLLIPIADYNNWHK